MASRYHGSAVQWHVKNPEKQLIRNNLVIFTPRLVSYGFQFWPLSFSQCLTNTHREWNYDVIALSYGCGLKHSACNYSNESYWAAHYCTFSCLPMMRNNGVKYFFCGRNPSYRIQRDFVNVRYWECFHVEMFIIFYKVVLTFNWVCIWTPYAYKFCLLFDIGEISNCISGSFVFEPWEKGAKEAKPIRAHVRLWI